MMSTGQDSMTLQPNSQMGPRKSLNRDLRKRELMKITTNKTDEKY